MDSLIDEIESHFGKKMNELEFPEWIIVSRRFRLTIEFIEKYEGYLFWSDLCWYQMLPEEVMEKYKNKIDWRKITMKQELSEDFIDKHRNILDWQLVSEYQGLSLDFVIRNANRIDWERLKQNKKIKLTELEKHKVEILQKAREFSE